MGEQMIHVIMKLDGRLYGVPVGSVREVLEAPEINPLPQSPAFVKGICRVRKRSIAVLDLRAILQVPGDESSRHKHLVVVRIGRMILGLPVDAVVDVMHLDGSSIDKASFSRAGPAGAEVVSGIAHDGDRDIVLLNLEHMLGADGKVALSSMRSS